ncbi:MAG TPA: DUF4352 domain-containing protein, partial [Dermatophilaceae bacterium]|nr:DUF4352 domain-containing protein [Dermatophilaceae bacterium]
PTKRPFYKKWWFWLIAALLVIAVVVAVVIAALRTFGNAITSVTTVTSTVQATPRPTTSSPKPSTTTPQSSTTTTTTPPPATGGSGQPGRDGDLQFTVTGVDCTKNSVGTAPLTMKADGVFCLVSLTVNNSGTKDTDLNPFFQEATDSKGDVHFPDLAALVFMDDADSFTDPVPAGGTAKGILPFDVPAGSTLTSIELHESFNSPGTKIAIP